MAKILDNFVKNEIQINTHLKLRLEGNRTEIYVNNRKFMQCRYLLLNISLPKANRYDNINSIDEAVEIYDKSLERGERTKFSITPEQEFIGHSSNLQAWYENDYDTRLLHSNLAFPLLKELTNAGDILAKRKFKEEIARRFVNGFVSGYENTILYLLDEGYLDLLSIEEFESVIDNVNINFIDEFNKQVKVLENENQSTEKINEINSLIKKSFIFSRFKHGYLLLAQIIIKILPDLRDKFTEILFNKLDFQNRDLLLNIVNYIRQKHPEINLKNINFVDYEGKILGFVINNKLDLNYKNFSLENNFGKRGFRRGRNRPIINYNNNILPQSSVIIKEIAHINGLNHLKNLRNLNLSGHQIEEINGLESLENLEILDLSGNKIK